VVASRAVMSGEVKGAHNASFYVVLKDKLRNILAQPGAFVTICAMPRAKARPPGGPSATPDVLNAAMQTRPR
jgi:hypothetical protein